ncbi:MAG TPA: hypothetical protein VFJ74_14905 [Gemmatimonadaceae bacterium]|nr:hypothetical protein [Gemmatimonadaceae bacterium]
MLAGTAAAPAMAQEMNEGSFFKAPVFVLQPGAITTDVISAPEGSSSTTRFNARFATVVPTASPWFSTVFGAQVQTGGKGGTPQLFYGGIIPIAPISTATGGMLGVSLDPLGVTSFGQSGGTVFVGELAVSLSVGKMMFANMGPMWSGTGAYFLVDQQISDIPRDAAGNKDRFNPALLYGLSIPFGHGK